MNPDNGAQSGGSGGGLVGGSGTYCCSTTGNLTSQRRLCVSHAIFCCISSIE